MGDDTNATATGAIVSCSDVVTDGRIEALYYGRSASTVGLWYPHGEGTIESTSQIANGTEILTLVYHLPKLSTVKGVTLFFPKITTSGTTTDFTLRVYTNNALNSSEDAAVAVTRDNGVIGWKYIPININNVNNIQLGITYNTSNSIGETTTITPSHAEIEFDTTTKIK